MCAGDRLYECEPETGRAAGTGDVRTREALERVRKKRWPGSPLPRPRR